MGNIAGQGADGFHLLTLTQLLLDASLLRDVVVDLKHSDRLPVLVPPHCPPARHDDLPVVSGCVYDFPLPSTAEEKLLFYFLPRPGVYGLEQAIRHFSFHLVTGPAVPLLCAPVPEEDPLVEVTGNNGLMGQV